MHQNLLTVEEITRHEMLDIFNLAAQMKRQRATWKDKPLLGKSIGMIFAKSSTRTRVSFEVGIRELGGFSIYLEESKLQVSRGETVADTARVLARYLHAIIIRTYKHSEVVEFATHAGIPVINALTDEFHPCQVVTDLFTMWEYSESLDNMKLTYLGDGASNMASSLILACKIAGVELVIASPEEYKPRQDLMDKDIGSGKASWTPDVAKAVENADYLYTDVWVSMGFEEEEAKRLKLLRPYQLNADILAAAPQAKVLHCLPAHRGEEITDDVMESRQSIVFDQAENRLHVQKAILSIMLGDKLPV